MKKILLILPLLLLAASCNKPANNSQNGSQSSNQQIYTGIVTTGFEGYYKKTTYTFSYTAGQFIFEPVAKNQNMIGIKDASTNAESTMLIFNNDGAGFKDSQEAWDNLKLCKDCKKINNNLNFQNADDQLTYENGQHEYVIFKHDPGFVVLDIAKPIDRFKSVMESLTLKTE